MKYRFQIQLSYPESLSLTGVIEQHYAHVYENKHSQANYKISNCENSNSIVNRSFGWGWVCWRSNRIFHLHVDNAVHHLREYEDICRYQKSTPDSADNSDDHEKDFELVRITKLQQKEFWLCVNCNWHLRGSTAISVHLWSTRNSSRVSPIEIETPVEFPPLRSTSSARRFS